jgi:molybdopterin converting factor small subunit
MGVKATLHPYLNGGVETQVEIEGEDVGECLNKIVKQFPEMGSKLFAKPGKLKGFVEILVNGQSTYPEELGYPTKDGDTMSVLVFLAGG